MGDHTGFFYGTLMSAQILHRVIHGPSTPPFLKTLHPTPALLPFHRRHKVRHRDYPAMIPSPAATACVRGTLVRGLSDADLWRLDRFEGSEYERVRVRVWVVEGEGSEAEDKEVQAETYVWVAGEEELEDEEWDFEAFTREKMGAWVGDEEFAEVDEAVRAGEGDSTGGRGVGGRISEMLEPGKEEEVLRSAV